MVDFSKEMDKYLSSKRRKKLFSSLTSKIMNKRAVLSYKTTSKFGELKGRLASSVEEIKKKKEEPKKDITQEEIDKLIEKKGIKIEKKEKIEGIKEAEDEGWKEVKLEDLEEEKKDLVNLEEKKRRIEEGLAKIYKREQAEKEKLAKLSGENEQRKKAESEGEKIKRLELEDEINVLKEKQGVEEDRLTELRKARRREQMEALRGRVRDILFKKMSKKEKDMAEEVRKEIRRDIKIEEVERKMVEQELRKPKEDVAKAEEQKIRDFLTSKSGDFEEPKTEVKETLKSEERKEKPKEEKKEKQKKSFFSNFIQIRTAAEIAKEEGERLKREEEQSLKDQLEANKLLQQGEEEMRTNIFAEEQNINFSTLFPGEKEVPQSQMQSSEDVIELDKGYKIKVVKN